MIDIKEMSGQELKQKIENIKAEREKTADALKRYEEELERRKQEVPLGVPCKAGEDTYNFTIAISPEGGRNIFVQRYYFPSEESARKHAEMLSDWSKDGLVANSKGEPIDITVLLPLLPKGHWVACDSSGEWFVFSSKPFIRNKVGSKEEGIWDSNNHAGYFGHLPFNLKPAEDWRESLMECGL